MGNSLAYMVLLIWPGIAVIFYKRMAIERAVIWSILGPYLLLPPITRFDFPLIPPLDKVSIPLVSSFLICVFMLGKKVPILPATTPSKVLTLVFLFAPLGTVLTNADPIYFETGGLPGLRPHDSVSNVLAQAIMLIPFLLGRRFLATETGRRELLIALVVAGLIYSVPMLVEIRLSPQINVWVYGFFQHDFIQMMRQGGFRPIVFLQHGLWVAFFAVMALVAAVSLWRDGPEQDRARYFLASGYLWVMVVLCKSAAALLYSIVLVPMVRFMGRRTQLRVAALLALVALSYPLLRGTQLVPVQAILAQAEAASAERAASLRFRFDNEERLLEHARLRPWFGWGPWGRNQLYDPVTGKMTSTIDGRWIIVIGTYGWVGYIAEFGLLALPLLMLARRGLGNKAWVVSPMAGPIALILGFNLFDMLPNATLIPFTWLIAGALLAYAEAPVAVAEDEGPPAGPVVEPRPRTIL